MKHFFVRFFDWYEKHTEHNTLIATALFATQIMHLIWLSLFVVAGRLTGQPLWEPGGFGEALLIIVDYFEIPAIIATSVFYINKLRQNQTATKAIRNLIFINSQWLHIFWITDEIVIGKLTAASHYSTILPVWLAWTAIAIDYLELPVILDTLRESTKIIRRRLKAKKADGRQGR